MPQEIEDITKLLHQWRDGDPGAEAQLFELVFPNLQRLAHYLMKGERNNYSMQASDLVNQGYLRLVTAKNQDWQNRQHFFAMAARVMRRYLVDHARGRPHAEFVALEGMENFLPGDAGKLDTILTINRLLSELAKTQPAWSTLVELKYFLGLTDEEAADVLGVKIRTMQRMWRDARLWLFNQLESSHGR